MYTLNVFSNYVEVTKTKINILEDITEHKEITTKISVKFLIDICKDWTIEKFVSEFEKTIGYKK